MPKITQRKKQAKSLTRWKYTNGPTPHSILFRLVPDWLRGRHRLSKPITDYSQAKQMPMTISTTTFDTQLKISFIVYNITIQRLVLKEFWTCLVIKSLYTDAASRYSLGLICRVIFCWLPRHFRNLFSVVVSICSKTETVCNKRRRNEYQSISLTLKKHFSLQHKLIHLRVAWNLCLVSVQQKPHIRLFVTFFPTRATDLVTSRCFRNELHLAIRYSFSQGEGGERKSNCGASIPSPFLPLLPPLPPPQTKKKTA